MQSMCRTGDMRNRIENRCFRTDFETCESIRIVEDRIAIHINRFLRAPQVFSSFSLKQHDLASPPLLHVPGGGVCDVTNPGSNSL